MILIDGNHLTIDQLINISRKEMEVGLNPDCIEKIQESNNKLNSIVKLGIPIYGINTGFGIFANKRIQIEDTLKLNHNLMISHAVGAGDELADEVVRAAMLIRANVFSKGFSGVRLELVNTLIDMLNKKVTPIVRSQGSLGSSGDLCMLSQMALVFTKDEQDLEEESGYARYSNSTFSGKEAMKIADIPRLQLGPKEGLALINGATFSAAMASLCIWDAIRCLMIANDATSLCLESLLGCSSPFNQKLNEERGLIAQSEVAENIRMKIQGSTLVDSGSQVQDPYSLRCTPQVHGAIKDTIDFISEKLIREINAAADNPLIFDGDVISGGNFHGEPVALWMDYLSIALTELSAISERRCFLMLDEKMNNGLPAMLVDSNDKAGINSGVMIPQYTAASLVLENRTLATPDSVQSLPTSANQEDHNANAMTAARHAFQIIRNTLRVLSIELFIASRAVDIRLKQSPQAKLGRGTADIYKQIRKVVPQRTQDALWGKDIDNLNRAIEQNEIL